MRQRHLHRTQKQTRQEIIRIISESADPLTRTQIAAALNRKKSPHLIRIIDELVKEKILVREVVTFHNHVQGYTYALHKSWTGEGA